MVSRKFTLALFLFMLLLELLSESLAHLRGINMMIYIIKPLLMPALALHFFVSSKQSLLESNTLKKTVLIALFFSFLGDVLLMVVWLKPSLFLLGLIAFLITHILYSYIFYKGKGVAKYKQYSSFKISYILIVSYTVFLLILLFFNGNNSFQDMKIPVIIYASVITIMVLMAFSRKDFVTLKSFQLVALGALLFMLSDSVIALNKFTSIFENQAFLARILIMFWYGLGQLLIVEGLLNQHTFEPNTQL